MLTYRVLWVDAPEATCLARLKAKFRESDEALAAKLASGAETKRLLTEAYHYRSEVQVHGIMQDVPNAADVAGTNMLKLKETVASCLIRPVPGYVVSGRV